ncbi:MAG: hypothetical protein GC155_12305 [Alphaproteobacteria bacterium]|nr:hypothetical protein [Alphaproteobacteria bacterium]
MRLASASLLAIAAGAMFAVCPAPAHAQEALMSKVYACADIPDAGRRHACFDALTPDLKAAHAAEAAASPQPTPAESFGSRSSSESALTAPVTSKPEKQAKREKDKGASVDRVSLPVRSIETSGDGYMVFTMQNGQVWKQTDTVGIHHIGDPPWTAEIRKAALGSFMLKIGKSAAIHVQRLN